MSRLRIPLILALVAALGSAPVDGARQSASDYGGIDPAVALAWERAGAHYSRVFDLPGFAFEVGEAPSPSEISTLPEPAVPFGLEFNGVLTESHLRSLGTRRQLHAVSCYGCEAANLRWLAGLKQVQRLRVEFATQPAPEDWRHLSELPELRELSTRYASTTSGLAAITRLQQLEALSLRFSDLTDDGLKKLAEMPNLRWLDLNGTKVTTSGLVALAGFPRLGHLELSDGALSAAAPAAIAKLTQLESLTLYYPKPWTDDWLKQLAGLAGLRELHLYFNPDQSPSLSDAGMKDLAAFPHLEVLTLYGAAITDAGLKPLSSLKHLRGLDISKTRVTDAGVAGLTALQQLTDLSLPDRTSDDALRSLSALPRLRAMRLPRVTAAGVGSLTSALPSLRINGLSSSEMLGQIEIDAAIATSNAEARLAALERVRQGARVPDLQRIDRAILSTLVASRPDRADRIAEVLNRIIAAVPNGSSPRRRMAATLDAVEQLADAPLLASRIEQFMAAALADVTDAPTRAAGLAVLGRARLAQGHVAQARTAIEASLALLPSPTDPSAAPLQAVLGQIEAADGNDARAIDRYITAAALITLTPAQDADLRALYRKAHGTDAGLEPALARRHRELVPSPIAPTAYVPSAARSTRVVLLELFTGSGCAPCVPVDLAYEGLLGRYPADAVAAVAYHLSIPFPDPMEVPRGIRRFWDYYYPYGGVPSVLIDGRADPADEGGSRAVAPKIYTSHAASIDKRLEVPASAAISVNATGGGDRVAVRATVRGLSPTQRDLRLHILLVERELGYAGENGIRQHPMVVRAVAGADGAGIPITGDGTTTHAFSLSAIRSDVETTLAGDIATRRKRGSARVFAAEGHAQTTIDPSRLVVVAFIQQGAAGTAPNVLQAAQADVVFAAPGANEGGPAATALGTRPATPEQSPAPAAPAKAAPVTWSIAVAPNARAMPGGVVDATITAKIDADWHVYSLTQAPAGPSALLVDIPAGQPFSRAGAIVESRPVTQFDPNFNMETQFFEKTAMLTVPVRIAPGTRAGPHTLRIAIDYQICSNRLCLPPATVELKVTVPVGGSTR